MRTYTNLKTFIILPGLFLFVAAAPFACDTPKGGGVFKSENFGEAWQQKSAISKKQTIASRQILAFEIDNFNPDVIYAGTENGLYWTSNGADNWELVQDAKKNPDQRASVLDIEISPQNSNLVYTAVFQDNYGRVFRRTDEVSVWEQVYIVSKEGISVSSIEIDQSGQNVYIGTSEGALLKSGDFGISWKNIGWFDAGISDISVNAGDNKIIYALVPGKGMFKSSDQGANWQPLPDPIVQNTGVFGNFGGYGSGNITSFFIDAKNGSNLFASTAKGIFLSIDDGQNWKPFSSLISPESSPISAMAQDRNNTSVLYYGAASVLYRTQNGGQSWTVHQLPTGKTINKLIINPVNPNVIYAGVK